MGMTLAARTGSTPPSDRAPIDALRATLELAQQSPLYSERLRGVELRSLDDLRDVPITTRADLQAAGLHGTRAVPLERVCHYGETSGTTGASNSTWLTSEDFERSAGIIAADCKIPGKPRHGRS